MTEVQLLLLINWLSVIVSALATALTAIALLPANGTRPIVIGLVAMSAAIFIGTLFLLRITYGLTQINSTGLAEVGVFYVRLLPLFVAAVLTWMGVHYWRAGRSHHHDSERTL